MFYINFKMVVLKTCINLGKKGTFENLLISRLLKSDRFSRMAQNKDDVLINTLY